LCSYSEQRGLVATKTLAPHQVLSIREAKRRINIWEGSVRSGKTVSSNVAWLKFLLQLDELGNDENLLMIGKTERTLKRNIIDPIRKMVGKNRCKLNAGTGELQLLGHTVYIAGANDERAVEKIQGLTLFGALADELSTYPESFFNMLNTRLSIEGSRLFATTNPESPHHYLKKNFLDKAGMHLTSKRGMTPSILDNPLNLLRMTFKLTDNPYLPEEYIPELMRTYKGLWRRRYIDGEWVIAEGAIYDMFDPDKHYRNLPLLSNSIRIVGVDYGTTNPFSAHAIEIRPEGLYIFAEYYEERPLTDSQLSKGFHKWLSVNKINPRWICIDPSAASFRSQLYDDGLMNVVNADNDVLDGIRLIASLFSLGKLFINPNKCPALCEELPGYSWDPKATEKGEDKPLKEHDHACDDIRYGIATTELTWRNVLKLAAA